MNCMVKPNFTPKDINKISLKFLHKLYEATQGDEWEIREIDDLYSQIEAGSYDLTNIPLKNNVIQHLLAKGLINIEPDRKSISITNKGKDYIYEES